MSTMIAIKSHFGEDVRRFSFPSKGSYDDLEAILTKLYGFEGSELLLQYVGEESDLVSISCTTELHKAISRCSSLFKLYISKRVVVMDENAPLFNSWVLVQSLVNSPPVDVEPNECKKTLEQIETLSQKVQTCKDLLKPLQVSQETPTGETPGEEELTKKDPHIKDLVLQLSKEVTTDLISTSERISSLLKTVQIPPSVESELVGDNSALALILKGCTILSNKVLADVHSNSTTTLDSVNKLSDLTSADLAKLSSDVIVDKCLQKLREDTLSSCNELSSSTTAQCLSDSEDISRLVMNM